MLSYIWKLVNWFQRQPMLSAKARSLMLKTVGVKMDIGARISENVYLGSNKLHMGKNSFINVGSFLDGNELICLEEYVRIGPYVKILTGTHNYRMSVIRRRIEDSTISKKVVIERGCWIGMGTIILPGIKISEGCIIAAGSVVIRDTEPNKLYAGNPAKCIKELSTEEDHMKS
ncbi:MAG: acyltransferase [Sporolactobacillus sp.]